MSPHSTASPRAGLLWGLSGVVAFSFTVIATRVAVDGLDPLLVGAGRAVVAAALAGVGLVALRQPRPRGRQWVRLTVVAGGIVLGFPLLTSFALTTAPASHGAVVIALLPAATAIAAVIRVGERPGRGFWVAAGIGTVVTAVFASLGNGGLGGLHPSDLLLLGAVVAAAVGYTEGGALARELGAWQTVSWALVVALPVTLTLSAVSLVAVPVEAGATAWWAFAYVALVSMFLGFVAWYRGLAIGPMTRVSQLQLLQPILSLAWAALVLGETLTPATLLAALAIVVCAAAAVTIRGRRPADAPETRAGQPARP